MEFLFSGRVRRLAIVLFWCALVFSVVMALLPHPPELAADKMGDKFHHMLAFAVMTGLAMLAWPQAERLRIIERLSFLGALIEVAQAIPVLQRDCDIRDWVADTLSILVVASIFWLIERKRARQ
jgi:hypothetical protein